MTPRELFREKMRDRQPWRGDRSNPEWTWRTRAAREHLRVMRGFAILEWTE